jgi:MFS transporter, DHA2 family, multidrug resistance protein
MAGQALHAVTDLSKAARQDDPAHWRALAACLLAVIAANIDPPVFTSASSGVQGALRVEPTTAATVVGTYYLIQAALMAAAGVAGDRYGLRRLLVIGLAGMVPFSILVAVAQDWPTFFVGRAGVDVFTAIVIPLSLANVMITFSPRVLPIAIGIYLSVQLVALLSAATISTLLYNIFGLGATWLPALACAALGFVLTWRWLPPDRIGPRLARTDAATLALWSIGMLTLVYGIVAFVGGWGTGVGVALLAGAILVGWAALRLSHRTGSRIHLPNVPFRVTGVALVTGAIIALAQSGTLLQLSNFLKGVQGYGPLQSGLAFAPFGAATLVAALTTGVVLATRLGRGEGSLRLYRIPIAVGLLIVGLAIASFALFNAATSYLFIGTAMAVLGIGASVANVPRTALLFSSIDAGRIGVAAGLNGACVVLGGALGNVAVTTMITLTSVDTYTNLLEQHGLTADHAAAAIADAQLRLFVATAHPFEGPTYLDVVKQVPGWAKMFNEAFAASMLVIAGVALFGAALAWLALRSGTVSGSTPFAAKED